MSKHTVALRTKRRGVALIGSLVLCLILSIVIGGLITYTHSFRQMTKTRTDSEAALLLAEAGLNDEIARIKSRMDSFEASSWATPPAQLSGEPYRGRKGSAPDVPGRFWVYASTTPGGTTAWNGGGKGYLNAVAQVGKSIRKVSIEIEANEGGSAYAPLAGDFNCIFFRNAASSGGHSEGPIAVGGAFQGTYEANQHGHKASVYGEGNIGMYVDGNSTSNGHTKKVFGGTNAHISGNISSNLHMLGGGQINTNVSSKWFQEQYLSAKAVSNAIRALPKVKPTIPRNNLTLNVAQNTLNGNLKVYEIDSKDIRALMTVTITGQTANDTVIIDVTGTSIDWAWQVNTSFKSKLVWNFRDAVSLKVKDRNFTGMLLAPDTNLVQENNIQGNVYADKWTTQGAPEIHFTSGFKFNGTLPSIGSDGDKVFKVVGNYQELK